MLTDEIKPALQGGMPAMIATCSIDGVPNATVISEVYYVDAKHVALSYQFFNKTVRNVRENPFVSIGVSNRADFRHWLLEARYERSETEGPVFDAMDMQIEAIASMIGASGVFKLRAADIYEVTAVRELQIRLRP
jgi:hypothetical protein